MNWQIIKTLVRKDMTLFFRNQFFAVVSGLGVVMYIVIYFLMPQTVDEDVRIAMYAPEIPDAFIEVFAESEMEIREVKESESALKRVVEEDDVMAGIVLTETAFNKLLVGDEVDIPLYFPPNTPTDVSDAYTTLFEMTFNDIGYRLNGAPLNIDVTEEILGVNTTGDPIAPRDQMLPMFAVFILVIETLGLANLITEERVGRTLKALMITKMNLRGLFTAKAITGIGLAFVQAALVTAVTGGLNNEPILILLTLLLGSLLVTGLGFLIASLAQDFMSVMSWGMFVIVIIAIPAISAITPGIVSPWIKIIPSFYLVDTLNLVINFDLGWAEVWQNLVILLASGLLLMWLGAVALGRKLR